MSSFQAAMSSFKKHFAADVSRARQLGRDMGFGALMQATERAWREENAVLGIPAGAEHTVGPCASTLVPCPCAKEIRTGKRHGACDWCAGSLRVTRRVERAIAERGGPDR